MSLEIRIQKSEPARAHVWIVGRLDGSNHADLDRELQPLLDDTNLQNLVLDLQDLDYISSAGLRSIFRARKALGLREGRVLVVNPQPQVQKVFDIVKAVPVREIFRSVEELDSYLDRIQARALDPDAD
ncbi:STAS domain-containing protein [Aquimonas voraii]|uniref:Anti-sigma factor antagonist n=1 Tax=Aquimonas voraii TaxID=265719 RepID=A0A1G6T6L8_9GAMM|nr:STAS domain-containing protein [Aquimonas voraii]SDD24659.1 anti-anti-sigma factor [Aquimonas voraii]